MEEEEEDSHLPLEEESGEPPRGRGGHIPLVRDGHPPLSTRASRRGGWAMIAPPRPNLPLGQACSRLAARLKTALLTSPPCCTRLTGCRADQLLVRSEATVSPAAFLTVSP